MHRELAYLGSTLPAPIELKGRTVKKTGTDSKSTLGKWENLIGPAQSKVMSPQAVASRCQEYGLAQRTIHPEMNNEQVQAKTRKIAAKEGGPEAGNILNLLKRSGTMDDLHKSKKKLFKEKQQTDDVAPSKPEKTPLRSNGRKQGDLCSQISTLVSPTYAAKGETSLDELGFRSCKTPTAGGRKRQDFLKSQISILPCGEDTKRPFQDRDETKIMQSACSPKVARHLATTLQDQPFSVTPTKKDPNRTNPISHMDDEKLNPFTKGRKHTTPKYIETNNTSIVPSRSVTSFTPKSGGVEPLDPRFVGRRSIAPKQVGDNISRPPQDKSVPRGQTVFSYRTFTSQIF